MRNAVFIGKVSTKLGLKTWASMGEKVTKSDFFLQETGRLGAGACAYQAKAPSAPCHTPGALVHFMCCLSIFFAF